MTLGISTRWNTYRHKSGEAMIEEILSLGFKCVELGYDLTLDLVPGIIKKVNEKAVVVNSVHNFCPVPVGAPMGHPELFSLSSTDQRARKSAVLHTGRTIEFAAQVGAGCVIVHAGNIEMRNITRKLIALAEKDGLFSPAYEKLKLKLLTVREKKRAKHLDCLYSSLEELTPILQSNKTQLALENLPSWESIPTEVEMEEIFKRFDSSAIGYWHDLGHGQVRQNLGFIGHIRWLKKLCPRLLGMHIHDVTTPAYDHLMPPHGSINFAHFKDFVKPDTVLVLEPTPGTPEQNILDGVKIIREAWGLGNDKL
ncbi:sugar phosphate isomerase/epimerase family protein [Verrucomicrobiota bacterium]